MMHDNARPRTTVFHKLGLSAFSLIVIIGFLAIGEMYSRYFLDINFRRTSRDFVKIDDNEKVLGNYPNARGISFGVEVFSDENGFRVPAGYVSERRTPATVFLGDSVTFGVGVQEEKTFVGLFREQDPRIDVINTASVGFGINDYERMMNAVISWRKDISDVYLVYCLNDFQPNVDQPVKPREGFGGAVKSGIRNAFSGANEFFGSRSKLFVLITGLVIDPSRQYFEWDRRLTDVDDEVFARTMQPIANVAESLASRGIRLTVVINPYEMQLRAGAEADYRPQDKVTAYLAERSIRFIDTRNDFSHLASSKDAFLFADPMHLNETGHRIVFDAIRKDRVNPGN
jgi:lysophospholipase L1-like esterase